MVQLPSQALSYPSEAEISTTEALSQHYRDVRQRLRHPPNAVPDTGLNMKDRTVVHLFEPIAAPSTPVRLSVPFQKSPAISGITFSSTLSLAAEEFGISEETLTKVRTRKLPIARARQIAIYIAYRQKKWSVSWIAKRFNVDHTTGLYAIKKVQALMSQDDALRQRIEQLEAKVALLNSPPASADDKPYLGSWQEGNVS